MKLKYNPQDVVKAISIRFPVIEADIKEAEKIISEYNNIVSGVEEGVKKLLTSLEYRYESELVKKRWFGEDVFNTKEYVDYDESIIENLGLGISHSHLSNKFYDTLNKEYNLSLEHDYVRFITKHSLIHWSPFRNEFNRFETVMRYNIFYTISVFTVKPKLKDGDYLKLKSILESCNTSAKEVYFTEDEMEMFKRNGVVL